MKYTSLTIKELHEAYVRKEVTPKEVVLEVISLLKKDKNNAIEYIMEKEALEMVKNLGEVEKDNYLWGIPFVIKDNFSTKDVPTTGSSNILNGYIPLFNATVVDKLYEKKAIPVAKSTLDELAMGGTGTTGHLGTTFNPYDKSHTRYVGGSSSGSAALTAAGIVPFSLGSDTGDSVRKPASYAGLVGFKPTWSRISRFGLFPFAPSLDTVGYFTRSVFDAAVLLNVLAGRDDKDSTSSSNKVDNYIDFVDKPIKNLKIASIEEIDTTISDDKFKSNYKNLLNSLKKKGAIVDKISLSSKMLASMFPTYFVISCAEATSNNANLDGIKFGPYYEGKSYDEVMKKARTKGFGELIKRRFIFGSFALMKDNQKDLFIKAQKNRRYIVDTVNEVLKKYDFIIAPAATSVAPKFNDSNEVNKLSENYLIGENHLVIANFAGLPSMTLPLGLNEGLPFGVNISGRPFEEGKMMSLAKAIEDITGLYNLYAKKEK